MFQYHNIREPIMTEADASNWRIPALFTQMGNIVGDHFGLLAKVTGGLGGVVAILDGFFGVKLVPYGTAIVHILTSDGAIASLLLLVVLSQILLYQRVEWLLKQVESEEDGGDRESTEEQNQEPETETEEVLTDGGSSDLPPRDSKGRFTTKESGGSNLFVIVVAAAIGYVVATESGAINPIAGALIAVSVISFLQAMDG